MRYLGVDPGGRRVGLATGDDEGVVVSPLAIIPYDGIAATVRQLIDEIRRLEIGRVVIGLPTNVDGGETPACRRSRALADALREAGADVDLQPEFLSSREAGDRARAAGRPRDAGIDDLAAAVILEDFLASARTTERGDDGV